MDGRRMVRHLAIILVAGMLGAGVVVAQAPEHSPEQAPAQYKPQFAGDPARSDAEAQALGYMRVVLRAENAYKRRHGKYAESLAALAATTDRGDYTASFRAHSRTHEDGFVLTLTPKHLDSEHRSFYAEEDGAIHVDDEKAADMDSPKIR